MDVLQIIEQLANTNDPKTIMLFLQLLGENAEPLMLMVAQRAQLGDQNAQAAILNILLAMLLARRSAKFGAKLNYIKSLRGQCPDGYEVEYFKNGGGITLKRCKACEKAREIKEPTNPIDAFKCGRKMKKKACGGDIKKAQEGTDLILEKAKGMRVPLNFLEMQEIFPGIKRKLPTGEVTESLGLTPYGQMDEWNQNMPYYKDNYNVPKGQELWQGPALRVDPLNTEPINVPMRDFYSKKKNKF